MKKILTLCLVHQPSRLLLGMKKRGFGAGRWNGFGGKVKEGETIEEAMQREVREEAGIEVRDAVKAGIIKFEFQGNPEILEVHIFRATEFTGAPSESDEMKPRWYGVKEIPYDEMWPDDKYWLPLFLEGKKCKGRFLFGEGDSILEHSLETVEML
ncbi:MAG: 8-oxo-dGTP diphosphatase [Candidatus Liptonbacteria bacterium]|nr:8-oxo-dGTP diphosphatase [Candidatus Liptonbacteria bacterium]